MNKIAVVTAVTGDYDHIGEQNLNCPEVDYIFFTDGTSKPLESQWNIELLPTDFSDDPRRLAKLPKIAPHRIPILRNYDYVIWIDGSMQIRNLFFPEEILSYLGESSILLSPHFDNRDCGYGEATIRPPKYAYEPFDEQIEFLESEGFPRNFGLWEAGVQAKNMNIPLVEEFGEVWIQQIMDFSIQDQVSLGYALWKTGLVPTVLPKSWREYDWLYINAHKIDLNDTKGLRDG